MGQYYWPEGVPRQATPDALMAAFARLGYVPCGSAEGEEGFEKIAIYLHQDGNCTHAARQLPNGKCTSKLGKLEDIEHETLGGLAGLLYGSAVFFMRRRAT